MPDTASEIAKLRDEIKDVKKGLGATEDLQADLQKAVSAELLSSRRASRNSVINSWVIGVAALLAGLWAEVYRRGFNEIRDDVRTMSSTVQKLSQDTALIQRDLRPIDLLDTRVRDLERAIDRMSAAPPMN